MTHFRGIKQYQKNIGIECFPKGPWLFRGFVGDEILPSYNKQSYKDPY